MTKHIKKIISFVSAVALLLTIHLNVSAQEYSEEINEETIHQVSYTLYDSEGNYKSSGTLPATEVLPRMSYSSVTLDNGDAMYLTNGGSSFLALDNVRITMSFGLNRNANVLAQIHEELHNTSLNSWSGFTGGLSFSATTRYSVNRVYGIIINTSSDPITVTWANFTF